MLIYRNTTDKEVKITLEPEDGQEEATVITVKPGEEYEVPAAQAAAFVRWTLQATTEGDNANDDTEPEDGANEPTDEGDKTDDEDETESETATVKNDRDFDVTVTYTEGEEEKTATVKAGDEIEVPADQEEAVKKQIADAEAEADEKAKEPEAGDDDADEDDDKEDEEESEIAKEKAALAEEKRKLLEEKAEMKFDKLCESGKLVPAQKDAFMALAVSEGSVALAEGKTESVPTLLEKLLESAPAHSLMKEEGESGEGESETELSDEEKEVAERFGNTEEEIKANKEK